MKYIKINSTSIITTVVCWLLGNCLHAQGLLQQISEKLESYQAQAVHEKLYVHTDKDYYLTGEILWFKIYAADASSHTPLDLSKVCYLELLDNANNPLVQTKIGMDNAKGNGSLYLHQSMPAGNYKLRAYTRWMQNFDAEWYFEKPVTVINLHQLPNIPATSNNPSLHIDFFPEGGSFVNGIENKIAFKAIQKNGSSINNFTGILLDNNDTLLRFTPIHNGMGHFTLAPKQGHHYTAYIIPEKGMPFSQPLPDAISIGTTIQVSRKGGAYTVRVSTNLTGQQRFYLLAHTRNSKKFAAEIVTEDGKGWYNFEQSKLDEGISAITLFGQQGEPLCERLVFKYPEQTLGLEVTTQTPVFKMRDMVTVSVASPQLTDNDSANVSLSVFKLDSLQSIPQMDIQSYLLLSADLKGYVDHPAYYFNDRNSDKEEALDVLLLTQGWRRFDWKNVLTKKMQQIVLAPELQGHIVTGQLINATTNKPANGVVAYLSAPSPITIFKTAFSNTNGLIKADLTNYFGSAKLIAQTEDKNYKVLLNSPFSSNYSAKKIPGLQRPVTFPNTLTDQSVGMQVQNIYTGAEMNHYTLPAFADTIPFFHKPDAHYNLEDYTRFTTVEEILREYVTLVDVRIKDKEINLRMIDPDNKVYFNGSPLCLLDGVPIFNLAHFFESEPKKIASLDIIAKQYTLGNTIFNGILNWKTYEPSASNYSFEKNVMVADYESLQLARVFYSPAYNEPEKLGSHLPDFRNVVYWQPDITIKKTHTALPVFYTSDLTGKYVIVVQGMTASGKLGSSVSYFEVK